MKQLEFKLDVVNGKESVSIRCPSCKKWNPVDLNELERQQSKDFIEFTCQHCGMYWHFNKVDHDVEAEIKID